MIAAKTDLGSYVAKMPDSIKKKDILINLSHTIEELQQNTKNMVDLMQGIPLQGATLKTSEFRLGRLVKDFDDSVFKTIANTVDQILKNEDLLVATVKKEFNDETLKVANDYFKIQLQKYMDSLVFFVDYSQKWLNAVIYETLTDKTVTDHSIGKLADLDIQSPTFKQDILAVNNADAMDTFSAVINMLNQPFQKFLDVIKPLKGHTFSESDWGSDASEIVNRKLDPYRVNLLGWTSHLSYWTGVLVNGWRVRRHEKNKLELARLQLLLNGFTRDLETATDDSEKKQLERRIHFYSNEINRLDATISAMEA